MSSFEEELIAKFHSCNTLFEQTRHSSSVKWCIKSKSEFTTSYQHLNSFGPNRLIRFCNKHISGAHYLFRSRMFTHVKKTIESNYFKSISDMGYTLDASAVYQFYSTFFFISKTYWKTIRNWSFTEYFSFLQQCCQLLFNQLNLPKDLYKQKKKDQNQQFEGFYSHVRDAFFLDNIPFSYLCYLVTRANWADSYEPGCDDFLKSFPKEINEVLDNEDWVSTFIKQLDKFNFYNLHNSIKGKPATFLYECDNNGEIYFDLILIEYMLKQNHTVIISTKSNPILNDVTISDLQSLLKQESLAHLTPYITAKKLQIIESGSCDVISLRNQMSADYISAYKKSNYVVLKGQGHFESYPLINPTYPNCINIDYKSKHYYLFGLKSTFTKQSLTLLGFPLSLQSLVLAGKNEFILK
jgi:uncharacterized protein with ATP-grasp and redox domains